MKHRSSLIPLKALFISYHASNTILISFLPLFLQYRGLSGSQIGWVLAVESLAAIIAQPFWGFLSDKYKTIKKILFICLIGLLIFGFTFFHMSSLHTILIFGAMFYFFASPIGGLNDSLAQRRAMQLGVTFGSIRMWGSVGFAISSLIVGEILSRYGIDYMVWIYLTFGVISLIILFPLTDIPAEQKPVQLKDLGNIIKSKPFLLFLGTMLFITVTHRMNDYYMALYIHELGGAENLIGLAWFAGVISEALVFAFAGFWFRRFHSLIFIIIAAIIYTIRWFLYASATDPMLIIALQFLHGITFGVFYTAAFDYVTRLIPSYLHSTGHLVFFAFYFGMSGIIGSLAGGSLIDFLGGSMMYSFMGILSGIGFVLFVIYHIIYYRKGITGPS